MKNKLTFIIVASILLLGGGYFFGMCLSQKPTVPAIEPPIQTPGIPSIDNVNNQIEQSVPSGQTAPSGTIKTAIKLDAPFVVQAPFGNWIDPIFQNACEEASIVMAMGWVNGMKNISPDSAQQQILDIVNFENKTFKYNTDTDVFDIQKIFQQFFHQQNVSVQEKITVVDIKNKLQKGNLVLVPAFGQALGNPNYTAPGPVAHMLVIIGYDPATHEFITNDTGTRHGSSYRYNENVLFNAIWEYPSGNQVPPAPTSTLKKAMIIVSKQ